MKWEDGRRSGNVEDRRGSAPKKALGIGGVVVVLVISAVFGIDPSTLMGVAEKAQSSSASEPADPSTRPPEENKLADFVSVVLADTEDTWNPLFAKLGKKYEEPKLVLFTGKVQSACGFQSSAVGPFYCPADKKAYIDLGFYEDLQSRHGAPGDFAQAYVIAHEIGHHVQNLLGNSKQIYALKKGKSKIEQNELSVRQELQADCYAGIWAHHAKKARDVVEPGDIAEALNAASAIGDDTLQRKARGHVQPESFTHGTAEQRQRWFERGYKEGTVEACDTLSAREL